MDKLPKGVQILIDKYLFESDYCNVRNHLLAETSSVASVLNDKFSKGRKGFRVKRCTYCTSGWICKLDVIMYVEPMCDLCKEDLDQSDAYNPPLRIHHTNTHDWSIRMLTRLNKSPK